MQTELKTWIEVTGNKSFELEDGKICVELKMNDDTVSKLLLYKEDPSYWNVYFELNLVAFGIPLHFTDNFDDFWEAYEKYWEYWREYITPQLRKIFEFHMTLPSNRKRFCQICGKKITEDDRFAMERSGGIDKELVYWHSDCLEKNKDK